jgi:hypothetical protein
MTFPANTMGGPQTIILATIIALIWYAFRKTRRR